MPLKITAESPFIPGYQDRQNLQEPSMELTITKNAPAGTEARVIVALAGLATISEVGKIKTALLAAMSDCNELQLDIGHITGADTALLQLIHAARLTSIGAGITFTLAGESGAVFHETAIAAGFMPEDDNNYQSIQTRWKE